MTEMVFGASPAHPGEPVIPRWWRTVDRWSLVCVLLLVGIGLLLGLAASPPLADRNGVAPFFYVTRQAIFASVAIGVMVFISMLSPQTVRRYGVIGFAIAFAALIFLPIIGTDFDKGATRWVSLGFISVQPSEFLKPALVILTGWLFAASQEIEGPPGRIFSFAVTVVIIALLVRQPDFGQAALVAFAWGVIFFVAGASLIVLGLIAGAAVVGGIFAYDMSEHFARRIDGFLSPDLDPRTQLGYATDAIREGGFFGVGVGEGQVKWSLPDAHTDFIIAVAAEEYGLICVLAIIMLYVVIVARSLLRLMKERDTFIRLAGTGLICTFGVQAIINMGVAVRLLPAKGMTLPFVSYGGSSLLAGGITLGMLLALTRSRPQGEMADILLRGGRE